MSRPDIDEITDSLDAALFNGDAFYRPEPRERLRALLERWEKRLDEIEYEERCECRELLERSEENP